MLKKALLITLFAGALSGCSTLATWQDAFIDRLKPTADAEGEVTMRSDYIASDLLSHFGDKIETTADVAIIKKSSNEWGSLEDKMRKKGFAVSLVKRLKNAEEKNPVIYTISDIENESRAQGVLQIRGKFQVSRLYEVTEEYVMNISPVMVQLEGTE